MTENITDSKYTEQYKELHEQKDDYGTSSIELLDEVCLFIDYLQPKTILDYGCGKGLLSNKIAELYPNIKVYQYDPSIPGLEKIPVVKADLVINTDVLEHIPENILPNVVKNISEISQNVYFQLHHGLAAAILPNGENAHCTVKPPVWYHEMFKKYFNNVNPLKGKHPINSVVITFNIDEDIKNKYNKIIEDFIKLREQNVIGKKHNIFKKYFYRLLLHITYGKTKEKFRKKYLEYK